VDSQLLNLLLVS